MSCNLIYQNEQPKISSDLFEKLMRLITLNNENYSVSLYFECTPRLVSLICYKILLYYYSYKAKRAFLLVNQALEILFNIYHDLRSIS